MRLPRDHVEVVERVHERRARLGAARAAPARAPRRPRRPRGARARRARSTAATFDTDASRGMNTSQPTPRSARRLRDRAAVVAGAGRDEPGARARAERRHLAERAAQLERAGPLQALGLQRHRPAGERVELLAGERRACARAAPAIASRATSRSSRCDQRQRLVVAVAVHRRQLRAARGGWRSGVIG